MYPLSFLAINQCRQIPSQPRLYFKFLILTSSTNGQEASGLKDLEQFKIEREDFAQRLISLKRKSCSSTDKTRTKRSDVDYILPDDFATSDESDAEGTLQGKGKIRFKRDPSVSARSAETELSHDELALMQEWEEALATKFQVEQKVKEEEMATIKERENEIRRLYAQKKLQQFRERKKLIAAKR